jgi:YhcH/YjgK/YiaL family protein
MIFGTYQDFSSFIHIPFIDDIRAFVSSTDCQKIPCGEIALKGKDLFVRVGEYETQPQVCKRFETHQLYADVQYVVKGAELIGTAPGTSLEPVSDYDEVNDIQFFASPKEVKNIIIASGDVALFFPGEAHQPGCIYQAPEKIKKLVFKIKMDGIRR